MYHMARFEAVTPGDLGVSGFAPSQTAAFSQQFRPRRTMDRAIHPSPSQQAFIGGIDDGVHVHCGDVVPKHLDLVFHGSSLPTCKYRGNFRFSKSDLDEDLKSLFKIRPVCQGGRPVVVGPSHPQPDEKWIW